MYVVIAAAVAIMALAWIFMIRQQDLPQVAGVTPWKHLEGRKASIYENLRDLQFEYRTGKLSDADYQQTKTDLQAELATVLAEIDRLKDEAPAATAAVPAKPAKKQPQQASAGYTCPHCKAQFDKALKFCGECGKPMAGAKA